MHVSDGQAIISANERERSADENDAKTKGDRSLLPLRRLDGEGAAAPVSALARDAREPAGGYEADQRNVCRRPLAFRPLPLDLS